MTAGYIQKMHHISDDVITHNITPFLTGSHLLRIRGTSRAFYNALHYRRGLIGFRLMDIWVAIEDQHVWMIDDDVVCHYTQQCSADHARFLDEYCDDIVRRNEPRWIPSGIPSGGYGATYAMMGNGRIYIVDHRHGAYRVPYADHVVCIPGKTGRIVITLADGILRLFELMDDGLYHECGGGVGSTSDYHL